MADTRPGESTLSASIVLHDVTKLFGRFAALREVSCEFYPGRICAIFGDNGAGKSTMLRAIAGLSSLTRGAIKFPGIGDSPSESRAHLGYMAHASMMYDEMSGIENLRYAGGLYGLRDEAHFADVIRRVGLDPDLQRNVGQYSQGMRQRMSLARAIVHQPSILLLDEPFSNVDVSSARQMGAMVAAMRDQGCTVLIITHQANVLEPIADESILMQRGRVIAREPGIKAFEIMQRQSTAPAAEVAL